MILTTKKYCNLGCFFGISYIFLILYHQREIYNVQLLMSIVSQLFRLKFWSNMYVLQNFHMLPEIPQKKNHPKKFKFSIYSCILGGTLMISRQKFPKMHWEGFFYIWWWHAKMRKMNIYCTLHWHFPAIFIFKTENMRL